MTSLEITAPNGFPDIVKIAPRTIVHPQEKYLIKAALHSHSWPIGLIGISVNSRSDFVG